MGQFGFLTYCVTKQKIQTEPARPQQRRKKPPSTDEFPPSRRFLCNRRIRRKWVSLNFGIYCVTKNKIQTYPLPGNMLPLTGKNMVAIGGSRGVGRRIVETAVQNGARVLAVARREVPLRQLAQEVCGVEVLSLDATDEAAPSKVFDVLQPDILVVCAGALPPAAALNKLSWQEFAVNWETDVKIAFHFCKAALSRPLPAGASVILMAGSAALAGSPISGGYAGAKRTEIFLANFSQKESDRLGLGLRFMALAPRIMPDTEVGKHAVEGYSRYLGISAADIIQSMDSPPTSSDVATAVIEVATNPDRFKGKVFIVSGKGLEAVPA